MNKEDSDRVSIIKGHQRDGGYLYEHVRMDIDFLLNKIEISEAERDKYRAALEKSCKCASSSKRNKILIEVLKNE